MTKRYMRGCSNYRNHREALEAFKNMIMTWCVLHLDKDGSATITTLQSKPVYPDQPEFIGSPDDKEKNAP